MTPDPAIVIGDSPGMLEAVTAATRVASTAAAVLIQGERGTGKKLLARFLHERSWYGGGPFVAVDCASFTGDAFERASGGTLLLDDVGELSSSAQVSLLRLIEDHNIEDFERERRVGAAVRLIAATDAELSEQVDAGRFRADLYYRLAVVVVSLPPLRERGDDVRTLAEHFVGRFAYADGRRALAISNETLAVLRTYGWPGNVGQLKQVLESATLAARGVVLTPADLPLEVAKDRLMGAVPLGQDDLMSLEELERRHVMRVLAMTGGHTGHAAHVLGIPRLVLHRRLFDLGLHITTISRPR